MSWAAAAYAFGKQLRLAQRERDQNERYAATMERRLEHIRLLCRMARADGERQNLLEMFDVIEDHAKVRDDRVAVWEF